MPGWNAGKGAHGGSEMVESISVETLGRGDQFFEAFGNEHVNEAERSGAIPPGEDQSCLFGFLEAAHHHLPLEARSGKKKPDRKIAPDQSACLEHLSGRLRASLQEAKNALLEHRFATYGTQRRTTR